LNYPNTILLGELYWKTVVDALGLANLNPSYEPGEFGSTGGRKVEVGSIEVEVSKEASHVAAAFHPWRRFQHSIHSVWIMTEKIVHENHWIVLIRQQVDNPFWTASQHGNLN
jgi:hypothetical protein